MNRLAVLGSVILVIFGAYYAKTVYEGSDTFVREEEAEKVSSRPLLFAGDIMLGRYVETLSNQENDELRSFRDVKDFLHNHVTVANLEGPIPEVHKPTPINGMAFSFTSSAPRILKEGGIAAVSLANNHMFDQGRDGYEHTKLALDAAEIAHFGGYAPTEDDFFETELGTTTVIVYGIGMIATGWNEAQAFEVTEKLRAEHPEAYLIAFLHWGDEYVTQNIYQRAFAHGLIDRGVDAIVGTHPHVVQGIENYNGKPIFYSLGNFIFDQYWRKDLEDGYVLRLPEIGIYEIIPIHSSRSIPYVATSTKKDQVLSSVASQSDKALKEGILSGRLYIHK